MTTFADLDTFEPDTDLSQEEWFAFHTDVQATRLELPTHAEVKATARALGLDRPQF